MNVFMSWIMYMRCCHQKTLDLGRGDWKLWLYNMVSTLLGLIVYITVGVIGPNPY